MKRGIKLSTLITTLKQLLQIKKDNSDEIKYIAVHGV